MGVGGGSLEDKTVIENIPKETLPGILPFPTQPVCLSEGVHHTRLPPPQSEPVGQLGVFDLQGQSAEVDKLIAEGRHRGH